jgi:hypothetical protein
LDVRGSFYAANTRRKQGGVIIMTLQERYEVKTSLITIYKRIDEILEKNTEDDIDEDIVKEMETLREGLKKHLNI